MFSSKIFVLAVSLCCLGCAQVSKTNFLIDGQRLAKGKYLEKVYISQEFKNMPLGIIEIKSPTMLKGVSTESAGLGDVQKYLLDVLKAKLNQEGIKTVDPTSDIGENKFLILETEITELDPGSQVVRWFFSEFGGGHTYVQVEGRLTDPQNGVLFEFADRRTGSASGGFDPTGGDSNELIRTDLEGIAQSLAKTLSKKL